MTHQRWFPPSPRGYCRPSQALTCSFEQFHAMMYRNIGMSDYLERLPIGSRELACKQIANIQNYCGNNGVTIFPEESIVVEALNTEALNTVTGDDVLVTFPVFMVTLPESQRYETIGHLLVSIYQRDQYLRVIENGQETVCFVMPDTARHLLITAYWENEYANNISVPLDSRPIAEALEEVKSRYIMDEVRAADELEETKRISTWACGIVFNLMLMMQSYPTTLVPTHERHWRPHVYRNKERPKSYNVRSIWARQVVHHDDTQSPGTTGGTVSPHWRRGHWRRQIHGDDWLSKQVTPLQEIILEDGRKAHMRRIAPVYVNPGQSNLDSVKE